jgi:hypothetical protein
MNYARITTTGLIAIAFAVMGVMAFAPNAAAHPCFVDEQVSGIGVWVCEEKLSTVTAPILCAGIYTDDNGDGDFDHGEGIGTCVIN